MKYIAKAGIPQQRIANYCGPDTKILKDIQTYRTLQIQMHRHIIHMYCRNDVI